MTAQFRILCDGQHEEGVEEREEEIVDAIAEEEIAEPVYAPGESTPPPLEPPL
jgi:hypothetical protein